MSDPAGDDADARLADQLRGLAPPRAEGARRAIGLGGVLAALGLTDDGPPRVGRFVIVETLGRGAMGTVYRARDPELQRDVALKVLDGRVDAEHAEAIRREARALARLAHPNVVTIHELGAHEGQTWVVMELVPGRTLRDHAQRDPRPSWRELVGLSIQAAAGLQAAHDAGLVHRDVKPENLLVREDGRVLVADFGLARPDGGDAEVAGTLPYLAPEVRRTGASGPRSDQYALCASLWRLLDPDAPLGSERAQISLPVRAALQRGLADDPADRWPGVRDLAAQLQDALTPGPGAHHREVLLDRVERLWIRGVLRASLDGAPPLVVPLADPAAPRPGAIADGPGLARCLEDAHGALLIVGEPGSGKTTALLRLAERLLERARLDPAAPMPVVLHLASLADHPGPAEAWVEQELVAKYNLPRRNVQPWLEAGAVVLLLDALDEAPREARAACAARIAALRERLGLSIVVTCRRGDAPGGGLGREVQLEPVPADALDAPPLRDAGLRTPLMVRLLEGAGERPPDDGALLPWLWDRYVSHAFARRAAPPARQEELLDGLAYLARVTRRAGRSELWLEQLDADHALDGPARAAAKALGVALLAAVCLAVNVTIGALVDGDPTSGLIFGLCSVPMVLAFNGGLAIRPVERLRFSPRRLLRQLPLGLGLGVTAGAIYGMFYLPWVNVVFGAVAGVVTVVTVAFEPSFHESGIRPNQGIRQSLLNGLGIGALGLVLGGLTLGYAAVPAVLPYLDARSTLLAAPHPERSAAAVAGPLLGVIAGMVRGGWAVLMHLAVRLTLAWTTPLPLRLVPLLDEATSLALLRRVGGGYLFPHRTLQEHLAARPPRRGAPP